MKYNISELGLWLNLFKRISYKLYVSESRNLNSISNTDKCMQTERLF